MANIRFLAGGPRYRSDDPWGDPQSAVAAHAPGQVHYTAGISAYVLVENVTKNDAP